MRVEVVNHKSGEQFPILLDDQGLPLVLPNEFVMSRRSLSVNTQVRNLRELAILYRWLENERHELSAKLLGKNTFNEADLNGGLVEALRFEQLQDRRKAVAPSTFNQRLTTVRQFFSWCMDMQMSQMSALAQDYDYFRDKREFVLKTLNGAFISYAPVRKRLRKGLDEMEVVFLLQVLNPKYEQGFGRATAVKSRNYVSVGLMLFCGLRPGELLSLRVEDIQIGAISAVSVERRAPDFKDKRKPRPQIKRNGRVIPIENREFISALDEYIVTWREELEERAEQESDYLVLSDEGEPLSQASITQFFQLLRTRYSNELPANLTAKTLRHTFSSRLERVLRKAGMDEQRRREALALLRGDSSLSSQDIYLAQEIEEQAVRSLKHYQAEILKQGS